MFDPSKFTNYHFTNYHKVDPANPEDTYIIRELQYPRVIEYKKEAILEFYESNGITNPTMDDYYDALHFLKDKQEKAYREEQSSRYNFGDSPL